MEQMMWGGNFYPKIDENKSRRAAEEDLEKYFVYKFFTFEEREASITANYSDSPSGKTNVITDQTASIAIYNVDAHAERNAFIQKVEDAVDRLPSIERLLIKERFMTRDSQYITDQNVYNFKIDPPMGETKYYRLKKRAMLNLAIFLGVTVPKN